MMMMGDTGAGKSVLQRRVLMQIAERGETAIVYDPALEHTPPEFKRLFEEYEEIVEGQMFSLLDDIEEKIGVIPFKVSFADGTEASVEDLQVYPSTGAVSFKTRQLTRV